MESGRIRYHELSYRTNGTVQRPDYRCGAGVPERRTLARLRRATPAPQLCQLSEQYSEPEGPFAYRSWSCTHYRLLADRRGRGGWTPLTPSRTQRFPAQSGGTYWLRHPAFTALSGLWQRDLAPGAGAGQAHRTQTRAGHLRREQHRL